MAPKSYDRLGAQDSSFLWFERHASHMHVAAVAIYQTGPLATPGGGLDIRRIRAYIDSRLHDLPRYRQRIAYTPVRRHPVWVDDDRFNLLYHVRHTSLPHPGDAEKLKELVGRILSQQLDRTKPLWEMWVVEGLEHERFAVVTKVHHCMVDGVGGVGLLTHLFSPSPEAGFEPAPDWKPRDAPSTLELLADDALSPARAPLAAAGALGYAVRHPRETVARLEQGTRAIWQAAQAGLRVGQSTPLNQPIGTHRRVSWQQLDLAEVKDLRKRLGGSVNDIVLAVVTGALRRFLEERQVPLAGLDFRVAIPVSVQSGSEERVSGNQVSAWLLSLPLDEPDEIRRFERIRGETARLKDSGAAEGTEILTRFADWTDSTLLTQAGVRLVSRLNPYNLIVTNVPGPQYPLYLLGSRLEEIYPELPLFENQGLGVAVMSYLGRMFFGLSGEWELVPDLGRFAQDIAEAFEDLRNAAESDPEPVGRRS